MLSMTITLCLIAVFVAGVGCGWIRAGCVMKIFRLRNFLYRSARVLGDVQSLQSPQKFVKRQARKFVYRGVFRIARKIVG